MTQVQFTEGTEIALVPCQTCSAGDYAFTLYSGVVMMRPTTAVTLSSRARNAAKQNKTIDFPYPVFVGGGGQGGQGIK